MNDEAPDIRSHIDAIARPIELAEISDGRAVASTGARPARFRVAMAAAVVMLVAGGAAVLVSSNRDSVTDVTGESAPTPFADEFSALGVLGEVPIGGLPSADGVQIGGTDLARISELTGVERTGSVDFRESPSDWLEALYFDDVVAVAQSHLLLQAMRDTEEFEREVGFSYLDIDRFVSATNYLGYGGEVWNAFPFDAAVLRSDVDSLVQSAGDDRVIDVGSGDDGDIDIDDRNSIRTLGQPLRVAVDGPQSGVAISGSTPYVEAWLDTDAPTAADEPDLAAAAVVLDRDDGLYSVRLEQFGRDLDDLDRESRGDRPDEDFRIVEEFAAVGMGWSGIGERQQITIVYVFADVDAAAASVDPIEELYSSGPDATKIDFPRTEGVETVPDVFVLGDVATDGRTVVVTGQATAAVGPQNVTDLLFQASPLGLHR